jgi:hypothetical protein
MATGGQGVIKAFVQYVRKGDAMKASILVDARHSTVASSIT